jgi:hypothetical protein
MDPKARNTCYRGEGGGARLISAVSTQSPSMLNDHDIRAVDELVGVT